MKHSDSIANLAAALVKVQAELEPVKREHTAKIPTKSGGSYSYSFASLEDVFACSRQLLTKHGLAVTQLPCETQNGGDGLRTVLLHESGEFISAVLPLRSQDANMQGLGAAITYARRYGYQSVVGIAAEEDDDAAPSGRAQTPEKGSQPSSKGRSTPPEGDTCPQCGEGTLVERSGTSKDNKPYHFWGCNRFPECRYTQHHDPAEAEADPAERQSLGESAPPAETSSEPNAAAVTVIEILDSLGRDTNGKKISTLGLACGELKMAMPRGGEPYKWLSTLSDEDLGRLTDALDPNRQAPSGD